LLCLRECLRDACRCTLARLSRALGLPLSVIVACDQALEKEMRYCESITSKIGVTSTGPCGAQRERRTTPTRVEQGAGRRGTPAAPPARVLGASDGLFVRRSSVGSFVRCFVANPFWPAVAPQRPPARSAAGLQGQLRCRRRAWGAPAPAPRALQQLEPEQYYSHRETEVGLGTCCRVRGVCDRPCGRICDRLGL
jgi:hypothetical protein